MRWAMIMAGGVGTRLWPMSRASEPKQLARLIERDGERVSLLRLAFDRLDGLIPQDQRVVCAGEAHRAGVTSQIPELGPSRYLGEPVGRDTVNAVGFAAAVLAKEDPSAIFATLTADQIIEPADTFRRVLDVGYKLVEQDPLRLVTFSITPTYPATGYGYVEKGRELPGFDSGAFEVERFVEKPNAQKAQAYVESGAFGWNAGMFVWSAGTVMDCLRRWKPESYEGLTKIADAWGTPDAERVIAEVYPTLPKISVDYAIMEPAAKEQARTRGKDTEAESVKVVTAPMDLSWLDVGSWPAFGETLDADSDGNRASGRATLHECKNSLVVNEDDAHVVAVLGAEDLIVVRTANATLVMPRDRAQDLKTLHGKLPDELK